MKRICASSWAITKNHCMLYGQQNVKIKLIVYWQKYLLFYITYIPVLAVWRQIFFIVKTKGIFYIHIIYLSSVLTILGSTVRLTPGYHGGRRTFLAVTLIFTTPPPPRRTKLMFPNLHVKWSYILDIIRNISTHIN